MALPQSKETAEVEEDEVIIKQREEALKLKLASSAMASIDEDEEENGVGELGPYSPGSPSRNRKITHLDTMLAKELRLKQAEAGKLPDDQEDAYGRITNKLDKEFARFRTVKQLEGRHAMAGGSSKTNQSAFNSGGSSSRSGGNGDSSRSGPNGSSSYNSSSRTGTSSKKSQSLKSKRSVSFGGSMTSSYDASSFGSGTQSTSPYSSKSRSGRSARSAGNQRRGQAGYNKAGGGPQSLNRMMSGAKHRRSDMGAKDLGNKGYTARDR